MGTVIRKFKSHIYVTKYRLFFCTIYFIRWSDSSTLRCTNASWYLQQRIIKYFNCICHSKDIWVFIAILIRLILFFFFFFHESWVIEEISSERSSYVRVNKDWVWKFSIQMRYYSGRRYVRMHERVACRSNPRTCFARGDLSLQFASLNIIISRNNHRRIACS